jgi:hypothetical protein
MGPTHLLAPWGLGARRPAERGGLMWWRQLASRVAMLPGGVVEAPRRRATPARVPRGRATAAAAGAGQPAAPRAPGVRVGKRRLPHVVARLRRWSAPPVDREHDALDRDTSVTPAARAPGARSCSRPRSGDRAWARPTRDIVPYVFGSRTTATGSPLERATSSGWLPPGARSTPSGTSWPPRGELAETGTGQEQNFKRRSSASPRQTSRRSLNLDQARH